MIKLQIIGALLCDWGPLPLFLSLLKCFHFFLMGFELLHLGLFFGCTLGQFLLKGNWVERHLMPHSHSTNSTWLLPPSTLGPFDFLMYFFESGKPFLNTHRSIRTLLLLCLKLSPLIRSKRGALLGLDHRRPIRLRGDVPHYWNSETATSRGGSCTKTRKGHSTSWRFLEIC